MIEAALQLEVEEYVTRHRSERDPVGHAVVVRMGRPAAERHDGGRADPGGRAAGE